MNITHKELEISGLPLTTEIGSELDLEQIEKMVEITMEGGLFC